MTIQSSPRSIEGGARRQDATLRSYRRYLVGGGALILVLGAFYWWTHSGNQAGPRLTQDDLLKALTCLNDPSRPP